MKIILEYNDESKFNDDVEQLCDPEMWDGMIPPHVDADSINCIITIYCVVEDISRISDIEIEFWNGNVLEFFNCTTWEIKLEV